MQPYPTPNFFMPSVCLVLLATLLLITPGQVTAQPAAEQPARELELLQGQIDDLSTKLATDRQAGAKLTAELADAERAVGRIGQSLHLLQQEISEQDQELAQLATQKSQQQRSLDFHKDKLRKLVRSAYATGRQERLKLFLNQQDPARVNRMLSYFDYFNRERIRHIEVGNRLLADLQQTEQRIAQVRAGIEQRYRQQERQLQAMQDAREKRATLLTQLNSAIAGKSQQLEKLQQDAGALQSLLTQIKQQQRQRAEKRKQPFKSRQGKLAWPVSGKLSKLFGSPKLGGVKWDGVLITAPEGSEVRAVHAGKVAYADWLRGYGLLMIIDHGNGYMSLYGHNQSLFYDVGEWIDADQAIALVGDSGGQKISGLYFSIRKDGKPTNPKRWCVKPRGRQT